MFTDIWLTIFEKFNPFKNIEINIFLASFIPIPYVNHPDYFKVKEINNNRKSLYEW